MANGSMISKDDAMALVENYNNNFENATNAVKAMRYDFSLIEELKNAGADITSVRVYFGMNEDNTLCSILVGCDADGNNYYGANNELCLDQGTSCPDDCGGNPL